jgi:hypothetical protein
LSGTRIYAGEARRRGQIVSVLAYQNSAKSIVRGPNAMILPLPAAVMPGRDNVLDTRGYKVADCQWPTQGSPNTPFALGQW